MISQTIEYALRAMNYLGGLADEAANSQRIAAAILVPQGYLSKVLRDLVCADLVRSNRGPHGGFRLARDPSAITLLEIVNAVDPIRRSETTPANHPLHSKLSAMRRCLDDAIEQLEATFQRTTLGMVLSRDSAGDNCHSVIPRPVTKHQKEHP